MLAKDGFPLELLAVKFECQIIDRVSLKYYYLCPQTCYSRHSTALKFVIFSFTSPNNSKMSGLCIIEFQELVYVH